MLIFQIIQILKQKWMKSSYKSFRIASLIEDTTVHLTNAHTWERSFLIFFNFFIRPKGNYNSANTQYKKL